MPLAVVVVTILLLPRALRDLLVAVLVQYVLLTFSVVVDRLPTSFASVHRYPELQATS